MAEMSIEGPSRAEVAAGLRAAEANADALARALKALYRSHRYQGDQRLGLIALLRAQLSELSSRIAAATADKSEIRARIAALAEEKRRLLLGLEAFDVENGSRK